MKVYIDGENCRNSIASTLVSSGSIINARDLTAYKLVALLQDVLAINDALQISYYASEIRLPNGYEPTPETLNQVSIIREYSRKWVANLKLQKIAYIKAGNLKVKSSKPCRSCGIIQEVLQEKGVDVRLAADMLEDAYTSSENTVVLFSSDTDLCPVLHKIKNKGKRIVYVCVGDRVNRALSAVAHETVTISLAKIKQYL